MSLRLTNPTSHLRLASVQETGLSRRQQRHYDQDLFTTYAIAVALALGLLFSALVLAINLPDQGQGHGFVVPSSYIPVRPIIIPAP